MDFYSSSPRSAAARVFAALLCALLLAGLSTQAAAQTVPAITIAAVTTAVTEGEPAVFTVTANPAPADDLTVNLRARDAGAWFYWPEKAGVGTFLHSYYVNATATIPGGTSSVNYELPTRDDNFHERRVGVGWLG